MPGLGDSVHGMDDPVGGGTFEEWCRAQYSGVLAAVALFTGNADVAKEATAEAFTRAPQRWQRLRASTDPNGWTYRTAIDVARRRERRRQLERRLLPRHPAPPNELVDATRLDVPVASRALPERTRLAVVLRYFAGLTEAGIANQTHVAPGTVSASLSVARSRPAGGPRSSPSTCRPCRSTRRWPTTSRPTRGSPVSAGSAATSPRGSS